MSAGRRARTGWRTAGPEALVVAGFVVIRLWSALGGYLFGDDFAFRYWAATSGPDLGYLFRPYGGHINPVGLLDQWVLQAVWPGSYLALAIFSTALQAVTIAVLMRIVARLTSSRRSMLAAGIFLGLSLFGLEVGIWWAAAMYSAPYLLFLVLAVDNLVAALQSGRSRRLWWSAACYVLAYLSFSRGFAGLIVLGAVAAFVPLTDSGRLGVGGAWRAAKRYWLTLIVFAVGYSVYLVFAVQTITPAGGTPGGILRYAWDLLTRNVLPAVWGGPWDWFITEGQGWPGVLALPSPTSVMVVTAGLLSAALVGLVWWARPQLLWFAGAMALFLLVILVVAGVARAGSFVASLGYRYTFDFALLVALFLALVMAPVSTRSPVAPRAKVLRDWLVRGRISGDLLTGLLLVTLATSMLLSMGTPVQAWHGTRVKDYVANGVGTFSRVPAGMDLLSQGVPQDLVHPVLMKPYASTQVVFTPQPGSPRFADTATDGLFGFDPDGRIVEQEILGPRSVPGPEGECGYGERGAPVVMPLDADLLGWIFYARLDYYSGAETTATVRVGPEVATVPIRSGVHSVYFPTAGPAKAVEVDVVDADRPVCFVSVTVGNRVSKAGGDATPVLPPPT
jgi:hypothetical protein